MFAAGAEIKIGVLKKRLTAESAENAEMKEIKKNTFSAGSDFDDLSRVAN